MNLESLESMYRNNFFLLDSKCYSLADLESMIPWERYIYINLYIKHLKDQTDLMKKRKIN